MTQRNKEYHATMELLLAIDFDVARPASEHVHVYQPQLIVLVLFLCSAPSVDPDERCRQL